ncbi:hypothetical protein AB7813_12795 [Tardiphaga sp. 20_F10_N6_6]|uniref:hypothetical protein n=1 Tax=Tardiphaga sp. 20_F10_N6_6 TaxID=3240788 RepID=UPI003F8A0213
MSLRVCAQAIAPSFPKAKTMQRMVESKQDLEELSEEHDLGASDYEGNSLWVTARRKPFDRETQDQCKRWQAQSIRVLSTSNFPGTNLALKLRGCSPQKPCVSEACTKCMFDFRSRLLEQSINVMPVGGTAYSIITEGLQFPIGGLFRLNVRKVVRRLQKRIERSPLLTNCLILGALDVSLEIPLQGPPFWQLHLYILIDHPKGKALTTAIKAAFPPEPAAKKPYSSRKLVDRLEPVGYSYKMRFDTHHSYINEETGNLNRDIKRNYIPDKHQPELLLFLDSYPIGRRMLLRGIRRHGRRLNLKVIRKFAMSPKYGRRTSR